MTVTLRNICRDYPAGGGILRELLQNADDAGASDVVSIFSILFSYVAFPSSLLFQ